MKRIVYLVMVIAMLASLGAAALAGCAPKPTPAPARSWNCQATFPSLTCC